MNLRLALTSAMAVILASVSLYPLIQTGAWFWAGAGAVIAAAAAGLVTRLPAFRAAAGGSALALLAVCPLLASPVWALRITGAIIVAVTAASRPRFRTLQALGCVITYLAALLVYLNAAFAGRQSVAGIVPTRASFHYLSLLVNQGMAERLDTPPVPGTHGVVLLAAAGIGLMAAAADLLAVRLRSPAIAGLPLLALYCVRITTSAKQGGLGATVVFCLGIIGYLAMLAADGRERLRIWGRLVTVWPGSAAEGSPAEPPAAAEAPDTRELAASGRRIGLAAACIALALPLLVPGISVHDLFRTHPSGVQPGGPPITAPNPLVQMQAQLLSPVRQTVLTYHTDARDPAQEDYLQVYVLNYDPSSEAWSLPVPAPPAGTRLGAAPLPVPGAAASAPRTRISAEITLGLGTTGYDARLGFLPAPYAPTAIEVAGSWLEDDTTQMVYSTQPQLSGLSYSVQSSEVIPDSGEEEQAAPSSYPPGIGAYLGFPAGPGSRLAGLAARVTKGAATPYEKAVRLQDYFLAPPFRYDLNVSLPGGTAGLTDFLFRTHEGFCQQFAFAMAALARLVGIPSRIAVGYTAGTREGNGNWKVTTADAHAWPELYFSGIGWIRFEPTPGGAGGQGTATVPLYALLPRALAGAGLPAPAATQGTAKGPAKGASRGILSHFRRTGSGGQNAATPGAARGHSVTGWIILVVAVAAGIAMAIPVTARSLVRRRLRASGDAALAHAVWRELRDDLADFGLARPPSESPRATAARIAELLRLDPPSSEALGRIASAEESACYATAPLAVPTLRADSAAVRRSLAKEAEWTARWRARLLPSSIFISIRPALQHGLDVFGWLDAIGISQRGVTRPQE